jgi:ribonuclease HII
MRFGGIDEAGYGPTLGPLSVVATAAEAGSARELAAGFLAAGTGVRDSKEVYRGGDLAALEAVALAGLAWLTGSQPATAADCFALLGETPTQRDQAWMLGADDLRLPLVATRIPVWHVPGVTPVGVRGALIQPTGYNRALAEGLNKADLELRTVTGLLAWQTGGPASCTVVDRLGGRRYYRDPLQLAFPAILVLTVDESPEASSYRLIAEAEHAVAFLVDGESHSPLTALASCVAKYARELHMHLFNQHWCAQVAGLEPTAGYPEDARRWLEAIGREHRETLGPVLIRGFTRS